MVNDDTLGFWTRDERKGALKYLTRASLYRIKKATKDLYPTVGLAVAVSMAAVDVVAIKRKLGR